MNLPEIKVDWTISVGNLVAVLVFIVGGITAFYSLKEDVRVLATRLEYTESYVQRIEVNQKENFNDLKNEIKGARSK